jgi:hypothetical protein
LNPLILSKASDASSGRVVEGRAGACDTSLTTRPSTTRPGEALGRFAQGERCLSDSVTYDMGSWKGRHREVQYPEESSARGERPRLAEGRNLRYARTILLVSR